MLQRILVTIVLFTVSTSCRNYFQVFLGTDYQKQVFSSVCVLCLGRERIEMEGMGNKRNKFILIYLYSYVFTYIYSYLFTYIIYIYLMFFGSCRNQNMIVLTDKLK